MWGPPPWPSPGLPREGKYQSDTLRAILATALWWAACQRLGRDSKIGPALTDAMIRRENAPGPLSPEVSLLLEGYFDVPQERTERFAALASAIKKLIKAGEFNQAAILIRALVSPQLEYTSIQTLVRHFNACKGKCSPSPPTTRLAVLSSFTSDQLVRMLELFLFAAGIDVELYEADYGVFRQEIIEPSSGLYAFKPGTILIATSWRDLTHWPHLQDSAEQIANHVADEQREWSMLWKTAHDRLGCQIIQNNFDQPMWRQLGNHELRHVGSMGRFITGINQSFQDNAPPFVTIHDIDALSAWLGRRQWGDERFFHQAKLPCAPECMVAYGHQLASVMIAQLGAAKKCLVLDLDNTLWGGVIGDDGLGGIRLGQGDAEGEAFLAFQRYVKKLSERGVILAVCSKNTDEVAREVFLKHPEMALKIEDISCFVANWQDKAANIRAIAKELNIGINALVFVDDNPAERAIVRKLVPEVAVPEVTGDPLDFIDALERHRYFQMVYFGKEDLQRTEMYRANAERKKIEVGSENIDDFLKSMQMVATIGPINEMTMERSSQLINKSNQFNLTTIRRSAAELAVLLKNPAWITLTVSLKDRFGDNGLISVLLAKTEGDALDIDTWLMSCRVLKRNVEQLLLNEVCAMAKKRGLKRVTGRYVPTEKNALVKDHYSMLGFETVLETPDGARGYELDLSKFQPRETFIEVIQIP
jgi:FkbH-like protein